VKSAPAYRELNAAREAEAAPSLHVAVVNGWGDFRTESVAALQERLAGRGGEVRLSLIDLLGTFGDSEKLHLFLLAFPRVRIFLPMESQHPAEVLNLFFRESPAAFTALLPCSAGLELLDLSVLARFEEASPRFAVLPVVRVGNAVQETAYLWRQAGRDYELARRAPRPDERSAAPWHGAAIYARRIFLEMGGFDSAFDSLFAMHLDFWLRAAEAGLSSVVDDGFALSSADRSHESTAGVRREIELVKLAHFLERPPRGRICKRLVSALLRGRIREWSSVRQLSKKRRERRGTRSFSDRELLARLQG
jgi:hypothetical protein